MLQYFSYQTKEKTNKTNALASFRLKNRSAWWWKFPRSSSLRVFSMLKIDLCGRSLARLQKIFEPRIPYTWFAQQFSLLNDWVVWEIEGTIQQTFSSSSLREATVSSSGMGRKSTLWRCLSSILLPTAMLPTLSADFSSGKALEWFRVFYYYYYYYYY